MTANPLSPVPPIGPTTGMTPPPAGGPFKPIDPVRVLRTHIRTLVVSGFVGVIIGLATWYLLLSMAPQWTSMAQLTYVDSATDVWDSSATGIGGGRWDVIEAKMLAEAMTIRSEEILREAIQKPSVQRTTWFQSFDGNTIDARQTLQDDQLTVAPVRKTPLIQISVSTAYQSDSPDIVNAIIEVFLERLRLQSENSLANLRSVFLQERDRAEEEIQILGDQLRQFTRTESIESLNQNVSSISIQSRILTETLQSLKFAVTQSEQGYQSLLQSQQAGDVTTSPQDLQLADARPEILSLKQQRNNLQIQLKAAEAQYGANHNLTVSLRHQIDETEGLIEAEKERVLREIQAANIENAAKAVESFKAQVVEIEPQLNEVRARMADLTGKLTQYQELQDRLEKARETFDSAEKALLDARISPKRPDAIPFRLQTSPTQPILTFPKIYIVVPGVTFLIFGLTTGLVFLRELTDQRIKSPIDVKLLPETDLLGVIPDCTEDPTGGIEIERIVERQPGGLIAESFRQCRTEILAKMDRRGYKTLAVAGAQPGAGVSALVHNLAASMALNGRSVLVLDANFRRPTQHRLAGAGNDLGLIDILNGTANASDVIVSTDIASLSLMPGGHVHDASPELLEGSSFRSLLAELESQYDAIVIDVAPALLTSDCQLMAKHVDAIAAVVRANTDHRGMVQRMLGKLDGQRADLLGVILNGVRSSAGGYFRKNYRDFYKYRNGIGQTNGDDLKASRARAAAKSLESVTGEDE